MVKVTFMGPKRHLMGVLDLVHSMGVVHLEPYPIPDQRLEYIHFPSEEPEQLQLRKQMQELLEKVKRLLVSLKQPDGTSRAPSCFSGNTFPGRISKDASTRLLMKSYLPIQS